MLINSVIFCESQVLGHGCRGLWGTAAAGRAAGSRDRGRVRAASRQTQSSGDPAGWRKAALSHPHKDLTGHGRCQSVSVHLFNPFIRLLIIILIPHDGNFNSYSICFCFLFSSFVLLPISVCHSGRFCS